MCSTVKICPVLDSHHSPHWLIIGLVLASFGLFVSYQCLRTAEEEVEKMAAIAEQEKVKNINMEKQLQAQGPPVTYTPVPSPVQDLQQALQEKDK